jgi:hypothetical protein
VVTQAPDLLEMDEHRKLRNKETYVYRQAHYDAIVVARAQRQVLDHLLDRVSPPRLRALGVIESVSSSISEYDLLFVANLIAGNWNKFAVSQINKGGVA